MLVTTVAVSFKELLEEMHSAGGHLAAMMLACVWPVVYGRDLPADLLKGALSISGLHARGRGQEPSAWH
jgi:hypothetical protein